MLKLQEFIRSNENWEEVLSAKPFAINIKRDGDYVLFSYNMIESDFSNPIVQEARGIIFYEPTWEVVCYPFNKFFNVQEGHAADIDWNTAIVTEKIDGSIIKLWFHLGEWHVSTNGTIDASKASLAQAAEFGTMKAENYYDLFVYAANKYDFLSVLDSLDKGYTYIFELVSPFNRVVVPYTETKIYHIGTRSNWNFYEEDFDIGIEKPRQFELSSLDECLTAAGALPFSEEGYVVRDWKFDRVKIKSPAYVAAHHLKNNGVITYERILELVRNNAQDDFVAVYPEYTIMVDKIINGLSWFAQVVHNDWNAMPEFEEGDRKSYALWAKCQHAPAFFFALLDGHTKTLDEWLWKQTNERILKWIGVE